MLWKGHMCALWVSMHKCSEQKTVYPMNHPYVHSKMRCNDPGAWSAGGAGVVVADPPPLHITATPTVAFFFWLEGREAFNPKWMHTWVSLMLAHQSLQTPVNSHRTKGHAPPPPPPPPDDLWWILYATFNLWIGRFWIALCLIGSTVWGGSLKKITARNQNVQYCRICQ